MLHTVEMPRSKGQKEKKEPAVNVGIRKPVHDLLIASYPGPYIVRQIVSDVLEWWLRQPAPFRRATMRDVDESMELQYAAALRKLAGELEGKAVQRQHPADLPMSAIRPGDEGKPESIQKLQPQDAAMKSRGRAPSRLPERQQ